MSGVFLTVEQAAEQLKLHPKTVLRHIKGGGLKATRLGKAYRIVQSDLDAFAGIENRAAAGARATCTVDVPDISPEAANRIAMYLGAASVGGRPGEAPLHVSTAFDPAMRTLKVVVIGEPGDVVRVLGLFEMLRS